MDYIAKVRETTLQWLLSGTNNDTKLLQMETQQKNLHTPMMNCSICGLRTNSSYIKLAVNWRAPTGYVATCSKCLAT